MKRDNAIDISKAIAIILMLIGHCETLNYWGVKAIFSFHMPLFFIFSGYFYRPKNELQLLKMDFKKLMIPYIGTICISSLICWILYSPIAAMDRIEGGIVGCIGHTGTIIHYSDKQAGPLWFLLSLFWCRSIFNFLCKRNSINRLRGLCVISFIFFWLLGMKVVNIPLCIGNAFTVMLFYWFGFEMQNRGIDKITPPTAMLFVLILIVWVPAIYYGYLNLSQYTYSLGPGPIHNTISFILDIPAALIGTICIYKLSQLMRGWIKRILIFIGNYTLEILCCHTIAFYIRKALMTNLGYDLTNAYVRDVFLVSISVILSIIYISYKYYYGTKKI